jgi:hypothetical protein
MSISSQSETVSVVIDLGASTVGTNQLINLNDKLKKCNQLWFTGYYIDTMSVADIFVELQGTGVDVGQCIMGNTPGNLLGTLTGGNLIAPFTPTNAAHPNSNNGVYIVEPTGVAQVRRDLSVPIPLLVSDKNLGDLSRMRVKVSSFAGAVVTWTRLILFFEATQLNLGSDKFSNYVNLPTSSAAHRGYNKF